MVRLFIHHLARLNRPDSPDSGKLRYVLWKADDGIDDDDLNKRIYYFEYDDNEDWNYVEPIYKNISLETPCCEAYILIGSFNGLICIYGTQPSFSDAHGPAIIFNPVTKEYIVLPDFDCYPDFETNESNCTQLACVFGYLAETNEYKVVRIYMFRGELNVEVEVYTVGSGKGWRHVGTFDLGFILITNWDHTQGVFLNGRLHWRNSDGGMVVVFDLADEKFRNHISPPPTLTDTDDDDGGNILIGVSGGGILYYALCQFIDGQNFDEVWLFMKKNDYLEMEENQSWGWIKVTRLDQREPFAFMEHGAVIRYDQGNVKICVSETSTWESCVTFTKISHQVFPHQHTLVSLKELGEDDAGVMESQGTEETTAMSLMALGGQSNCCTRFVFLNGCLHWRNTEGGMVVGFDLVDEKFREHITPPPILTDTDDDDNDTDGFILIGVSGGGILYYAVCQFIDGENLEDIWLFMKKNDNLEMEEHQSWGWIKVPSLYQREPFAFIEDGAAICYDQGIVKWFLSETSTFEGCVSFNDTSRQAFPYQHTLVSLKELGEEDAKKMEPWGIEETNSSENGSA